MDWFKWYHDSTSDSKFYVIAKRVGCSRSVVIAFWAWLLEQASNAKERGDLSEIDIFDASVRLDEDENLLQKVFQEMENKKLIQENRIANWGKRQPLSNAEKCQNYRNNRSTTPKTAISTLSDTSSTPERHKNDTLRAKREEVKSKEQQPPPLYPPPPAKPTETAAAAAFEKNKNDEEQQEWLDSPLNVKINATKEEFTEVQWLKEQVIHEMKRSGFNLVNAQQMSLQSLMGSSPTARKLSKRWMSRTIPERMAAMFYAIGNSKVKNELAYALEAMDKKWEGWAKLVPKCEGFVKDGDYTIEV